MSINEAIKKAIEGGWFPKATRLQFVFEERGHVEVFEDYHIFLDPLFWQALGKSLGWSEENEYKCRRSPAYNWQTIRRSGWHAKWIELIDHLAEGKDAESWFGEISKENK